MKATNIFNFLCENWAVIVALIAIILAVVTVMYRFFSLPTGEQLIKIKECLLGWVIEAEKELGRGTGEAKLRLVYSQFVMAYPMVKTIVSFELFKQWVDDALNIMENMLKSNEKLRTYVGR